MKLIVLKNNIPFHEVSVDTTDSHEMHEVFVGRSEDCHVQIDDPLISRHHFVIKNENGSWVCEKLTTLGTVTLHGAVVTKTPIKNGDEIKCGLYSVLISELSYVAPEEILAAVPKEVFSPTIIETPAPAIEEVVESLIEEPVVEEEAPQESSDFQAGDEFSSQDELSSENDASFGEELSGEMTEGFDPTQGEGDEFGLAVHESENESTRFFKAFVNYQLVLFGEHAPYDRFQIDENEIFIGRDPKKCQIILNDPEVSSVHAVIRKNNVEITLEDLGSSNGTILNAERINKAQITTGDEFVIGSTSFTLEVTSDLLDSESDRLMPVEADQVIETEEVEEEIVNMDSDGSISFDSEAPVEKSIIKRILKNPQQRKKAIYAVVFLGVLWLMFGEEEKPAEPKVAKEAKAQPAVDPNAKPKLVLSQELENARNVAYELGVSFFEQSRYDLAEQEFQKVVSIDPEYKKVQSYLEQTRTGLKRLAELEEQRKAEEERIRIKKLIEELLVKARDAVKEKNVPVAESYFSQIIEKDPENIEVSQLKLELESWQKEEERKALEIAAKEAARKKMVDSLRPGKTSYLKKEWYRAILQLEEFLRIKGTDEDLVKEGSDMLSDAKNQLASELGPLIGKARSLKEGQDLKGAYEAFLDVLKVEPTNMEALNEVDDIKNQLESRSKRIYREAIIAESLSLFTDAKEKFQEVQQISPTDSEYYKKAQEKLKDYLE